MSLDEFQPEDTLSWTYFINRAAVRKRQGPSQASKGKMSVGARGPRGVLRAEESGGAVAKLVYTAWHDGSVRGICFPSKELCGYTRAVAERTKVTRCDRLVSTHPVCYVAEQLVALQLPVVTGCSVTYYTPVKHTSMNDLVDFLHAARPTVFGTTPRVWERLCFYAIYAWKKGSGLRKVLQKRGKEKEGKKKKNENKTGIDGEFLPIDPKERRLRRRRERKERVRALLGLGDVHFAYSYRAARPRVEQFFALRGLQIACVDGFPEAGGACTLRLRAGAQEEEDLVPGARPPRWREAKMLLTRRGDYVPKEHVESLFSALNDPVIERVELVSSPWQSIGAVIFVDGAAASELLTVPRKRLWRSRDLSEYLRAVVHRVNQGLPHDQRISCFTQHVVPEGGGSDVPLGRIVAQMYKEENLVDKEED